ncbi:hypothetical protein SAMN04489747_3043 [Auraticoccus monumenti]|uniref:Uncharacterized protein n=1 Tax=Auraticoccus monumenti TaxID=675864 RepID=A0A1G7BRL8_9ACTN|nr:hypothetical protein SAMN04489747_3043 [Auraticoccus monumenti]
MRRLPAPGGPTRPDRSSGPAQDGGAGAVNEVVPAEQLTRGDPVPARPAAGPTPRVPVGVIGAVTWLRLVDRTDRRGEDRHVVEHP